MFVGPNNAGKTNLSDSLEFLGQVARSGLEVAVSREGGFENLAFRRSRRTRQPVRFSFKATTPALASLGRFADRRERRAFENLSISVAYEFQLRASSESRDADFRVTEEDLEMCLLDGAAENLARVRMTRRETDVSVTVDGLRNTESGEAVDTEDPFEDFFDPFPLSGFDDYLERTLEPTALALTRAGVLNTPIRELLSSLGRTRLFQLTPVECRRSGSVTPNPELDRHGANLPAVVRYIQRNHSDAWGRTLTAMRTIMPGLTTIQTEFTTDRRLALLFHETGARPWTSGEVSDGTMQSLALFTCLFDPRIPVVLIEEPENSVHPWIVKMFVDACREVKDKQVLITTHSPALISYLRPAELDVVWRDADGRTQLRPLEELDPQAPELWRTGQLDLYELIDGGWVRETIPPGLQ